MNAKSKDYSLHLVMAIVALGVVVSIFNAYKSEQKMLNSGVLSESSLHR